MMEIGRKQEVLVNLTLTLESISDRFTVTAQRARQFEHGHTVL